MECWIGRSADGKTVGGLGTMMMDTGATVSIVTQKWVEVHELTIKPAESVRITSFTAQPARIMGKVNFTVQVGALELQLGQVLVQEGEFNQGIIGGDVWMGKPGILGPLVLRLPGRGVAEDLGSATWPLLKTGVQVVTPFLPITGDFPPPPEPVTANQLAASGAPVPATTVSTRFVPARQTTLEKEGVNSMLTADQKAMLLGLAESRQRQREGLAPSGLVEFKELMTKARTKFESAGLPAMVAKLLQQVVAHYNGGLTMTMLIAQAPKALQKGRLEGMGDYLVKQGVELPKASELPPKGWKA